MVADAGTSDGISSRLILGVRVDDLTYDEALEPLFQSLTEQYGWTLVPSIMARATPAGRTVRAVYEELRDQILKRLRHSLYLNRQHQASAIEIYLDVFSRPERVAEIVAAQRGRLLTARRPRYIPTSIPKDCIGVTAMAADLVLSSSDRLDSQYQQLARQMERGTIVALLADGGWKYLSEDVWTRDLEAEEEEVDSLNLW